MEGTVIMEQETHQLLADTSWLPKSPYKRILIKLSTQARPNISLLKLQVERLVHV